MCMCVYKCTILNRQVKLVYNTWHVHWYQESGLPCVLKCLNQFFFFEEKDFFWDVKRRFNIYTNNKAIKRNTSFSLMERVT